MKEIQLSKGQVALVDDEDFDRVSQHSWYALFVKTYANGGQYVARSGTRIDGKLRQFLLHRFILNAPDGTNVDHIDRNPLNCKRNNLRLATRNQNCWNTAKRSNNTTGFKGVSVFRKLNKYRAVISCNKQSISLGLFHTSEEAAKAYDKKAKELFGEFAYLNFPDDKFTNLCDHHESAQAETEKWEHYEAQFGWAA